MSQLIDELTPAGRGEEPRLLQAEFGQRDLIGVEQVRRAARYTQFASTSGAPSSAAQRWCQSTPPHSRVADVHQRPRADDGKEREYLRPGLVPTEQSHDSATVPDFGAVGTGLDVAAAALAMASRESIGWFRYYFDDQRWEWSEELQRLHGYQPGTVTPTTELVVSHKHPDDRETVAATIEHITQTRGVFSSRHRIVDTAGAVHSVVVIAGQFVDDDGKVIGTHGFYIDLSVGDRTREEAITARLGAITQQRAAIEQVKGMLMVIYDVNEDVAFRVLKSLSQDANIKLRRLAEQIGADLRMAAVAAISDRSAFDHALLSAHLRVTGDP